MTDFLGGTFPLPPLARSRFDCVHQGISEGWSDLYHKFVNLAFADVAQRCAEVACGVLDGWIASGLT